MKIGIYSGMFDPVHLGHKWVIEQAHLLFDELHIVIGPNPAKVHWFTEDERKVMLEDTMNYKWKNVKVSILQENNLMEYANKLAKDHDVFVVRGIRDTYDYCYESVILKCMRGKASGVEFIYFHAPDQLKKISSTIIKDWAIKNCWNCIEPYVHHYVGLQLIEKRFPKEHRLLPYVAKQFRESRSIFETTTAGFPMDDGLSLQQMAFGEANLSINYQPENSLEMVRGYFDKALKYGLISLPKILIRHQVSDMIDDCNYDVISSTEYHLMEIPIHSVKPTGSRYQSCSTSLGPIIVDKNFFPEDGLHPVLIIEGKHRWLDAVERGEESIWAWVGDKVLDHYSMEIKDAGSNIQILGTGLGDLPGGCV